MTLVPMIILAILIGIWLLSMKIMRTTISSLSDPGGAIRQRLHVPSEPGLRDPLKATENWAGRHGFLEDVMFDFSLVAPEQTLFCKTWKNRTERTYLVFYFGLGKHFIEFVTIYDDKTGVTTTNAGDAHTLPAAPGAFIQAFPGKNMDELYALHHEGRATLERRTGLEPQDRLEKTTDLIVRSLIRQAQYVQKLPGWKWKGLWWMTVRKHRMIGRNIGWQLDQFGVHEPVAETPKTLQ